METDPAAAVRARRRSPVAADSDTDKQIVDVIGNYTAFNELLQAGVGS